MRSNRNYNFVLLNSSSLNDGLLVLSVSRIDKHQKDKQNGK